MSLRPPPKKRIAPTLTSAKEWDRKQNRDRIRKLKAKGKDDPAAAATAAAANGKDRESSSKRDVSAPQSTEATAGGGGGGVEQRSDDDASSSCGEGEAGDKGGFSRRKLDSNAWRYQEAEEELECPDCTLPTLLRVHTILTL